MLNNSMLEKIKNNLSWIFVIICLIIIFLLGKSCGNKSKEVVPLKVITVIEYKDTIFPKDTIIVYSIRIGKPIHDTIIKPIYLDSSNCNKVYTYQDSLKTKEYNIYTRADVQGLLRDLKLSVKLKVPLIIKDSVVIKKDSLIFKPNKYQIQVGLLTSTKMIAPSIDLSIDKCTYTIAYDPFNKQPIIGFKYRLFSWTPKKDKK